MRGQMIAKACAAIVVSFVLSACGGGGGSPFNLGTGSSGSSSGSTGTSSSSSGSTGSGSSGSATQAVAQTITLTSAQASITADGTSAAVLTAQIFDTNGAAMSGVSLNFSTSAGKVNAASVTTDSSGKAIDRLTASATAGRATITVRDPNSGLSASTNVAFLAGPAAAVSVVLAPSTVLPGATTSVDAIVVDANGNAVSNEPVTFSTTTNASGGSFVNISATSDVNGRAQTTYSAGSQAGSDTLAAKTAGGLSGSAPLSVSVGATLIGSVKLTLGTTTATADGTTQTTLRALVSDTNGNPVPNVSVSFSSTVGTLSAVSATTDGTGNAAVFLTSPSTPGTATVVAKTAGFSSSGQITFVAGAPANVMLSASPSRVPVGGKSTIQASVTDANGTPVSNVSLVFSVPTNNSGGSLSVTTISTDSNGNATVTYQSGSAGGSTSVQDTVKAVAASGSGGSVSGTIGVQVSPGNAVIGNIVLSLGTASIPAAAGNSVAIDAVVTDTSGNPVIGTTVSFSTTRGSLSATSSTTNSTGLASVNIVPPTMAGVVTIQASAGGFYAEQSLTVVPGPVSVANSALTASPSSLVANGTSTSTITLLLNDAFNNPLPDGTSETLLTQAGTFTNATQTLTNGAATFVLKSPTAAAPSNVVSVQAISGLSTPVAFITNSTGDPSSIRFQTSPTTISVGGVGQNDQSTITVTVVDSSGNPINEAGYVNAPINNLRLTFIAHPNGGETLTAKDVSGTIQTSTTSIDVSTTNGIAVVSVQSGTISGAIEVEAQVLKFSGTSLSNAGDIATSAAVPQLSVAAGPASSIAFSYPITNSITNLGNGNYRRKGKVDVSDRYGNPVADGSVVNLAIMDSVIVQDSTGVTTAGSPTLTRSGNSLITRRCATEPPQGGEASNCATATSDFNSTITRNGTARGIQNGDLILMQNAVVSDKRNTVSSVTSGTALTAITNYLANLTGGQFWIGTAALGASVGSLQTAGDETGAIIPGTATTVSGIAEFRISYPANVETILTGCYGYNGATGAYSTIDLRSSVPQSRQTVIVASAGTGAVAVSYSDQACFSAIAGSTLTPQQTAVSLNTASSTTVGLLLRDGGDTIPLPYVGLNCTVSSTVHANVSSVFHVQVAVLPTGLDNILGTDVSGEGGVIISRTDSGPAFSGDSATVSCQGFDSAPVTITVTPNL